MDFSARFACDLSCFGLVVQASLSDCVSFDPFAFEQDGLATSEIDVGGSEIVEALMVSPMVVMLDDGGDLGFQVFLREVVFEQDAVLQRLVPAFDLALRLRMAGSAVDLVDLVFLQPFTEIGSEPPRLYRRPFGLSYAAIAGASSMA
jgi:hypothetical protein